MGKGNAAAAVAVGREDCVRTQRRLPLNQFTNEAGATLTLAGDVSSGNFTTVTNRGLLRKTAGTGVAAWTPQLASGGQSDPSAALFEVRYAAPTVEPRR